MGIVFNDFAIKGIDVSEFNGTIEWQFVKEKGCDYTAIRVGHGRRTDSQYNTNWTRSKGLTVRIAYWFMDYYSNHSNTSPMYGISDENWGKQQANYCWEQIKNDNDNIIVFLDIESGALSYSPPIATVTSRAQTIARAFLTEMDRLNGKFNGIYCSLGLLSWFGSWFKNRPLWVAWYNEMMTVNGIAVPRTGQNVINNVKAKGWTGECLIWQYTSDGDATDDGIPDGLEFGMDYKALDLNGWIAGDEAYSEFTGRDVVVPPPPPPPPVETPLFQAKVIVSALNIRRGAGTNYAVAATAVFGKTYDVFETSGDWMRIGVGLWFYGIPAYVTKISTSPIPEDGSTSTWQVTAFLGLNIRRLPTTASPKIGWLKYGAKIPVLTIDENNWGKLADREGWVSLAYAKKL